MKLLLAFAAVACTVCMTVDLQIDAEGNNDHVAYASCDLQPRLRKSITAKEVVELHDTACETEPAKRFTGEVLAYVTPWNSKGYDNAKKYGGKFTFIAPVWLQLRDKANGHGVEITGLHDIDLQWMQDVRKNCQEAGYPVCSRITPRIMWETRRGDKMSLRETVIAITGLIKKYGFDGVVLEAPLIPSLFPFYGLLHRALHKTPNANGFPDNTLILVMPPAVKSPSGKGPAQHGITPQTFIGLAKLVDRFSLMTYDFSVHQGKAGPNSPINWAREVITALVSNATAQQMPSMLSKILAGVPFYGYDNTNAIVGPQYIDLLRRYEPLMRVDKDTAEHFFPYDGADKTAHVVYYPTPWMLQQRLQLAEELGSGISIWEIGQGLPYFYDLF